MSVEITLDDAVRIVEMGIRELDSKIIWWWELSRSEGSQSRYLHVMGGQGKQFVMRVSDHPARFESHDAEILIPSMNESDARDETASFLNICNTLPAFDQAAYERKREKRWEEEANKALEEYSLDDLTQEFISFLERDELGRDTFLRQMAATKKSIPGRNDEEKTVALSAALGKLFRCTVDASDVILPYYNAMKYVQSWEGNIGVFSARADSGNFGAKTELDQLRFVQTYFETKLCEKIPDSELDLWEWFSGWVNEMEREVLANPEILEF